VFKRLAMTSFWNGMIDASKSEIKCLHRDKREIKSLLFERRCREVTEDLGLNELKGNSPYPPFRKGDKKVAFTLAEVLVTLGIIGVVAAMTIPMLAKNYQFYIRQQQFKKAFAELSIALQKAQIDMGEGVKCYYRYENRDNKATYKELATSDCPIFYAELIKNLNIIKSCEGNAVRKKCIPEELRGAEKVYADMHKEQDSATSEATYTSSCSYYASTNMNNNSVYITNSGYSVMLRGIGGKVALFALDINAHKGPNKWGYDVFFLEPLKYQKKDSIFTLSGTTRCGVFEEGGNYSRDFVDYLYGRNTNFK